MSARRFGCTLLLLVLAGCSREGELVLRLAPEPGTQDAIRVLFIAGRDSHGPGAHEHRAGSELLARALRARRPVYAVDVVYGGWPVDDALLDGVDTLVFYADGGAGHPANDHLDRLDGLLDAGVGVVALHYAVEVPVYSAAAATLLRAIGGYFETDWSVNPHWTANFARLPGHPVAAGVEPFSLHDEWYFNMRFRDGMQGVSPILAAVAPADTMARPDGSHSGNPAVRRLVAAGVPQVVAWVYQRSDGGRGFGYTGGHFHANWEHDQARRLVLNAIIWTAGEEPLL